MKDELFLKGTHRLTIKNISSKDLEEVRHLHNEESTLSQLTDNRVVTAQMQKDWFKTILNSQKSFRFVCRLKKGDDLVGVLRIDNLDYLNESAMIGLDIAERFRRQGFALEIYQYFIKFFFDNLNFHRLYLNTLDNNYAARKLYDKLGFNIEGKFSEAIKRENQFIDLICYFKLNESKYV